MPTVTNKYIIARKKQFALTKDEAILKEVKNVVKKIVEDKNFASLLQTFKNNKNELIIDRISNEFKTSVTNHIGQISGFESYKDRIFTLSQVYNLRVIDENWFDKNEDQFIEVFLNRMLDDIPDYEVFDISKEVLDKEVKEEWEEALIEVINQDAINYGLGEIDFDSIVEENIEPNNNDESLDESNETTDEAEIDPRTGIKIYKRKIEDVIDTKELDNSKDELDDEEDKLSEKSKEFLKVLDNYFEKISLDPKIRKNETKYAIDDIERLERIYGPLYEKFPLDSYNLSYSLSKFYVYLEKHNLFPKGFESHIDRLTFIISLVSLKKRKIIDIDFMDIDTIYKYAKNYDDLKYDYVSYKQLMKPIEEKTINKVVANSSKKYMKQFTLKGISIDELQIKCNEFYELENEQFLALGLKEEYINGFVDVRIKCFNKVFKFDNLCDEMHKLFESVTEESLTKCILLYKEMRSSRKLKDKIFVLNKTNKYIKKIYNILLTTFNITESEFKILLKGDSDGK